jgi:hypothetical protein
MERRDRRPAASIITGTTTQSAAAAQAPYVGATAAELSDKSGADKSGADKIAAGVSQKVLFQRRGDISLYPDRLVLDGWTDSGDLVLTRPEITSVEIRFTELYGRFLGGLLNAGKPLILRTADAGETYLLINRKEFTETTDDRRWEKLIKTWLADEH